MPAGRAFQVRQATRADVPGILGIYNEAVANTTASYDYQPRTLEQRIAWFDDHVQNQYPVLVAVADAGEVIGWSALSRFHERAGFRFTTENSIYVAVERRGQGIGTQLMPPLIEAGRRLGLHAIIAAVDAGNEASLRLHARFGFERVGCFKEVGWKFSRWLDVVYLELILR